MPPEIEALIDKPFLLAVVLGVGALIGMAVESFAVELRRRAWRKRNVGRWNNGARRDGRSVVMREPGSTRTRDAADQLRIVMREPGSTRTRDAADQLRIVMRAQFFPRPLLNKGEARVFKELDRMVLGCNPRWQVMAQVSLGEILGSEDKDAYWCINAKRVDLLLVDEDCRPRHAIEYQGGGHHQQSAAARDAVKKEALRRAGIGYHEVVAGQTTPLELRRLVEKLVTQARIAS